MFILSVILCTIGLVLAYLFLTWLYHYTRIHYYVSKLNGPKGLSYPFGNVLDLLHSDERLFKRLRKWGLEHYPIYKVDAGPTNVVNLVGPEDIEQVISSSKHMEKSEIYKIMLRWLGTGLLTGTGIKWQTRRKILTPAFHFSILQQFITVFNKETENLVDEYEKLCENKESISLDVMSSVTQFTLCTINETSMGTKLNFASKEDKKYKDTVYAVGQLFVERLVKPWLWAEWFYYFFTINGYKEKKLVKILHDFTNNVIAEKSKKFEPFVNETGFESYSKRKNMALLDILLNAKFTDGSIDDEGIREEVDTFMFEGHDTTSMAICLGLMLLACNPEKQDLIYEELEQVLGDSTNPPTYEQFMELKYMERCIKEILRIYPSVPFISRVLSEDIVTKSGYKLPYKTIVNVHIYDLHHNPNLYEDPEKFDPDRFLPENCQKRHPFAYLPFSAGPRNCIGQRFALLEYKAVLCGILRTFKLKPIDTPDTIVFIPDLVIRPKYGVNVKFVKRC